MSSALKPVLPPTGAQTSAVNPPPTAGKPISGAQGMAQHAGAPGPYSTGPLGHVPQNLGGLPHPHGNMGLPSTNMAANMSMNTVANMSQMSGHGGMNQTPPHNMQGSHTSPIKSSALPPATGASALPAATAAAVHGRPAPHSYLSGGSVPPGPPQEEGTTLPPSQNSAQLMAMHRAQQQNQQHNQNQQQHHSDQQQQQQPPPQPIIADRFKPQLNQQPPINQQQPQPQQVQQPLSGQSPPTPQQPQTQQHTPAQSNGTVSGSSDPTNNKITVPTPPVAEVKPESAPQPAPAIQNHVTPSSNEHDVNNSKQPENSTPPSVGSATVPPQIPAATIPEPKPVVAATPATEPATEAPQQAATTPTKAAVVPKDIPIKPPSTMKVATIPRTTSRKREMKKVSESPKSTPSPSKTPDGKNPGAQNNRPPDKSKTPRTPSEERKSKRTRIRTQPYQSPIPELALITKLSSSTASPSKAQDEKLIVFYKNEFLAVRNAEGGFYVCQVVQNVYKSSLRIRIRWLSQDKQDKIYIPDFYDTTEFDCILTNLNMERVEKGKFNLPKDELERTENILKRALAVESGEATPSLTEEHPDGLDLSLFRDESQLKKKRKSLKRKSSGLSSSDSGSSNNKRSRKTPNKSKVRKFSKSPPPKAVAKRNNQSSDRKSTSNFNSYSVSSVDKKDGPTKALRKSDGGRAERAKRRGETATPIVIKTSPVVDQKKARVLAKVVMKTAIPASSSSQNKKKAGRNTPTGNGKAVPATIAKTAVKSTRSAAAAINTSTAAASSSASTSSSSTRRGKKTKK